MSGTGPADGTEVRFGFLGAGWIAGQALAPAVHAARGARLQAVAARDVDRAAALRPHGRVHGSYPALLADPEVDVVYLSLHNSAHLEWCVAALEAGKHVLCEKPLALNPDDLAAAHAAAARAGRMLVEAFWYRWHPRTRRLEELLAAGALGPVRAVEAEFSFAGAGDGDPALHYRLDPERGGGGIYDVGCYALSAAHLALGPDLTVTAAGATRGRTGVDLAAHATLRRPDGARADVRCGIAAPDRQALSVLGEAARLEFGDPAFTSWHLPSALTITTPDGAVRREEFAPVDPYRVMVEAVAERARGGQAFVVGPEHSVQVAASTAGWRAALADG